jgi:hypothetical protein
MNINSNDPQLPLNRGFSYPAFQQEATESRHLVDNSKTFYRTEGEAIMSYAAAHTEYMEITKEQVEVGIAKLVSRETTSNGYAYQMRLLQLGALEGRLGNIAINPDLQPVLEALHQVLAGGTVEIKIAQAGNLDVVTELNRRLERATIEANAINKNSEYTLLAAT